MSVLNPLDSLPAELLAFRADLNTYCQVLKEDREMRLKAADGRYPQRIKDFMDVIGRSWCAPDYDPEKHGSMLADNAAVAVATLEDIRRMFTFCIRSERFETGAFGSLIESGRLNALLKRVASVSRGSR